MTAKKTWMRYWRYLRECYPNLYQRDELRELAIAKYKEERANNY